MLPTRPRTSARTSGKAKEAAGKPTDNERLEAEGQMDQAEADLKQRGEQLKDAGEDVKDAFKPLTPRTGGPGFVEGARPTSLSGSRRMMPYAARLGPTRTVRSPLDLTGG